MEVSGIDIKRYEDGSNESQGGVIDLDSETKLPTGILRENAVAAVIAAQGRKDDNDKKRYIYAYIRIHTHECMATYI
jgi:predicted amidohydrolase YtcJ